MDKDEAIRNIRSTLLSCKGSLTLQQCDRDYKQLQGEPIPYRNLGFNSLQSLFESVPGFSIKQGHNGEFLVDAIPSKASMNITQLISKQKTTKKQPAKYAQPPRRVKSANFKPDLSSKMWSSPQKTHLGYFKPEPLYMKNSSKPPNNQTSKPPNNQLSKPPNNQTSKPLNNLTSKPNLKYEQGNNKHIVSNNKTTRTVYKESAEAVQNYDPKYSTNMQKKKTLSAAERMETLKIKLELEHQAEENEAKRIEETRRKLLELTADPKFVENKTRLLKHCELSKLPEPVFKVHEEKPKGRGRTLYHCSVKIGTDISFTTYPNSLNTYELAVETASSKALNHLHALAKQKSEKKTTPPDIALDRLVKIIAAHSYGVFDTTLPTIYQTKYESENLPENWKALIKSSPSIKVEEALDGMTILIYVDSKPVLSTSSSTSSISLEDQNTPPALQYPADSQWNVFIMSANSTIEVWVRIIGDQYSVAFESMNIEMEVYFMGEHTPSTQIAKGGWYALKYEDEWLRTRILEVNWDSQTALCFLVDIGDEECHPFSNLYDLPTQFLQLAPQAILCRLSGLECFSMAGISSQMYLSETIVGKVMIAEIVEVPDDILSANDPTITIVLYDTSTDQDLNLNKSIIQQLTQEAKPPQLVLGIITPINICDIHPDGTIYAQIHNENWTLLQTMLEQVVSGPFPKETLQASCGPLKANPSIYYLVKMESGDWRRAILQSETTKTPSGDSVVMARFIDYGITQKVPTKDILLLERVSAALNSFPVQVLKLALNNVPPLREAQFEYLKKLLPRDSTVLCKLINHGSNAVEVFVRTQPHDLLCSVNNALNMEIEMSNKALKTVAANDPVSALLKKKERIFSPITNPNSNKNEIIPKFKTPEKDAFFNIFVPMAANPSNFTVQSLADQDELSSLMTNLQAVATLPSLTAMPIVGGAYAAYHEKDECWYRVCVQGVLSYGMASIYYYDYGDLQMIETSKLKELPAEFRKLPAQAIKAKLYGVSPVNSDWSVEDCFRFQEIVVEKSFVSVVKEIEQDPIDTKELLLTLDMIDTSTEEEVYINKMLVKEKRAKLR